MKYKSILISSLLGLATITTQAQTDFYLNGYGRAIITNNSLSADNTTNTTVKKAVGGYGLFDLSANFKSSNSLWANAILRVKSPFGGFFGSGTTLGFRQFQVGGKIGKFIKYELGDINIGQGLSPYAVNNFDDLYTRFESPLLAQRRDILTYENFNTGNLWRLQGAQANALFSIGSAIDTVRVYGFVARTNSTNDLNIPDRILSGGRIGAVVNPQLNLGANYVGLLDVAVNTSSLVYSNHVLTGDLKANLPIGTDIIAHVALDGGFSTYNNKNKELKNKNASDSVVAYNDFYYESTIGATYKPVKLKLLATYRNVGPQFSSPTAQTRRVNNFAKTTLLGNINASQVRQQSLFDRYTQEDNYNRVILPTFQEFNPIYSNIFPYGTATPNRTGFTVGINTDTTAKIVSAEFVVDAYKEIIGEGTKDLRSFLGFKGGMIFNLGKLIESKRDYIIQAGIRNEKTTRSNLAKVDLSSSIIDLGASIEALPKLDVLVGAKKLVAKGNEFVATYNQFNMISENYTLYQNINTTDLVYSIGVRYRIAEKSFFTVNYNVSNVETTSKVDLNQLFINLTTKF